MPMDIETAENEFKLRYDGEPQSINAATLIRSIIAVTTIIEEVNNELETGKSIEINIRAPQPGSFIIHVELIETLVQSLKSLFTAQNVEYSAAIITTVTGVFQLRQFLKKEKPLPATEQNEGSKIILENSNGNQISISPQIFKIYNSSTVVNKALDEHFDALEANPKITAFEILSSSDSKLFASPRQEFEEMVIEAVQAVRLPEESRVLEQRAELNIVRASLDQKLKWNFLFLGVSITARIIDEDFLERVDRNEERFGKGDILDVDLQIGQVWDESLNAYKAKGYQVVKVYEHIQAVRPVQFQMGLDSDATEQ